MVIKMSISKFDRVQLKSLELHNFMNVDEGKIILVSDNTDSEPSNHVMGIYGQNGSGKTAFIHALAILRQCFTGAKLDNDVPSYIQVGQKALKLYTVWKTAYKARVLEIYYDVTISKNDDENQAPAQITEEIISVKLPGERKKKLIISNEKNVLAPKKIFSTIFKHSGKELIDFKVNKVLIKSQGRSYLFSDELYQLVKKGTIKSGEQDLDTLSQVLFGLKMFAWEFFYVIGIKDIGFINLGLLQPVYYHVENLNEHYFGSMALPLNGSGQIPSKLYTIAENFVHDENEVLKYLIPGLQIKLKVISEELDKNAEKLFNAQLMAIRNGKEIPLKYESAGIKKILSILHVFIGAFNQPSMIVAIDELDAGIFEYLLGELLSIFQEEGKGQLIFTSHNLRPLEVLDKQSIVFTTTNSHNRYIHLKNVKNNNNLRDVYYRTILLGGQEEEMYQETNRYELELSLKRVGSDAKK